jgi:hypothetical protein
LNSAEFVTCFIIGLAFQTFVSNLKRLLIIRNKLSSNHYFRNNSGSFATLAAMRLASSLVSSLAAERRLPRDSRRGVTCVPRHVTMPIAAGVVKCHACHAPSRLLESSMVHRTTRAAGSGAGSSRHFHLGFGGIGSLAISASRHQIDDPRPSQKLSRK